MEGRRRHAWSLSEKNYVKKISRQMRQKALLVALSRKYKDGEIIFVDSIEMKDPKAKMAKEMLAGLSKAGFTTKKTINAALIALPTAHAPTQKSFNNFGHVDVVEVRNLNPVSVLGSKFLIIADPKAAIETLSKKQVVQK